MADELSKVTRAVEEVLEAFDDDTAVLRAEWTGEAADAYAVARADWRARIDAATAVLARSSAQVAAAATSFAETEQPNAARW